jgi:predicted ArsR family transcriptional regulator
MANELTEVQKLRVSHYTEMAKLVRAFKEKYGEEAYQIVIKQNGERAFTEWKNISEKNGSNSIEDLIKCLWEPLKKEGFDYEVEKTEAGFQMKCTRCGLYDLAKHFGITEEAFYMICECDPYIAEGFNPKIGFRRTKTLMQGHDCCDHFYYMK